MTAMLTCINPYTGTEQSRYASLTMADAEGLIERASVSWQSWRFSAMEQRAAVLKKVAQRLRQQKPLLAELMALEMGKPLKEGLAEVEKGAWCAEHYAEHGASYLADEVLSSDADDSRVSYQPLGVILGILPWNAPVWLAFRFLAPALMAGNTCVMKHDPNVPRCAEVIAGLFQDDSIPQDIVMNLPLQNQDVHLAIEHSCIAGVSFTGSSATGRKVAACAAMALKPAVLELGGSDPLLVMADADLDAAADVAVLSRIINAGQSCIAAKRILVEAPVAETFIHMLVERMQALQMGDPLSLQTDLGPLARGDLRQNLHRQVSESIAAGATCLLGGGIPDEPGFFYPATVLADVTADMAVFKEETFGPVMAITSVADFDEAIRLANQTDYGLGASIWTGNATMAANAMALLEAGQVAVNGIVKTDPRLPSGGIKQSGYGRELGPHGIREFVNTKQLWMKTDWS